MLLYKEAVAAELFSAAWCNLNCTYCYVPKDKIEIKDKHNKIIQEAKEVTPLIEKLKKLYGENLKILSHWGTEPSLTIEYFKDFYKSAIKEFPNLETINISSNFAQNTEKVVDFIQTFPTDKIMTMNIQISLDGPSWITDKNRKGTNTSIITNNIIKFIKLLNEQPLYHRVRTHFKPTVSKDEFAEMIENNKVEDYYRFWDELCEKLKNANVENNVEIGLGCEPTIVCPDDYTQQDGINFYNFYEKGEKIAENKKFNVIKPLSNNSYEGAFIRTQKLSDEFFTKQKMFTCSAGDSQFGIGDNLHPCHDPFFCYEELNSEHIENKSHNILKQGLGQKNINKLTEEDIVKTNYIWRSFHDFTKFKVSFGVAMAKELANAGLISNCYKYDDMATLLSIYINSRHSCFVRQLQKNKSIYLLPMSLLKLFGNGVLERFIRKNLRK